MSSEEPGLRELAAMLHAVLYAFQDALGDADKRVCFYVSQKLPAILGKFGFDIDKDDYRKSVDSIIELLNKTGYVNEVSFYEIDERTFRVSIGKCALAETGAHELLRPNRAYCPYAIIIASVIQAGIDDSIVVSPSEFSDDGSTTLIRRYRHAIIE